MTIEQFNKAFDIVTNRLDKKDEGKVVTSYNNFEITETDTCDRDFHKEKQNNIKNNNPNIHINEDKLHTPNVDSGGVIDKSMTRYKRQRTAKLNALGKIKKVVDLENRV